MNADQSSFRLDIETTDGLCPPGERYAKQHISEGRIPVLSCEGPCIRGEIVRQAAHRVAQHPSFARACQAEAVTVPHSSMAQWIREAEQVLVMDGCFLKCQARTMRRMERRGQLVEIDVLPLYRKYNDLFEIDSVPEAERLAVAEQVAQQVLAKVAGAEATAGGTARPGNGTSAPTR